MKSKPQLFTQLTDVFKLKPSMRTKQISTMVIGCLLAYGIKSPAYAETSVTISAEQQQAMGLESANIKPVSQYPVATISATTMFALNRQHSVSAPLDGRVVAMKKVHGKVQQGDLIFELQSPKWVELQAELMTAQVELDAAQQNLKRAIQLAKSGASSTKSLSQAKVEVAKWQSTKTMLASELQNIGMSKQQLDELLNSRSINTGNVQLVAMKTGQLFDLQVKLGDEVAKGDVLTSLGEDEVLVLDAPVPVKLSQQLQEGAEVLLTEFGKTAKISHVHDLVDSMTQTVDVHILVDNTDGLLHAGQITPVKFFRSSEFKLYEAPATALSKLEGKSVVFVINNSAIEAQEVSVHSASEGVIYFSFMKNDVAGNLPVVIKGSAAVKAAFNAGEEE